MNKIILSSIALIFLVISGCATHPIYKPLQEGVSEEIHESHIVYGASQEHLNAEYEVSSAGSGSGMMFGALGALVGGAIDAGINASRANTAEEMVIPLRDLTEQFDFRKEMNQSLVAHFEGTKWHQDEVLLITDGKDESFDNAISNSNKQTSLVIATNYAMTPSFDALKVTAHVNLFPNTEPLKEVQKSIYRDSNINNPKEPISHVTNSLYRDNIILYVPLPPALGTPLEDNRSVWSENDGELLLNSMAQAVDAMPALIKYSLETKISDDENPAKMEQMSPKEVINIDHHQFTTSRNFFGLTAKLLSH